MNAPQDDAPSSRNLSLLATASTEPERRALDRTDLVESLPGAVFQLYSDRSNKIRYRYVSHRAQEILGLSPEAILADPLAPSKLVTAEDSAKLFESYRGSAREMKPFEVDVRITRADGVSRWVRTAATPRLAHEGFVWDGYWTDVNDEVEARVQLERSEHRLHEITASLPGAVYQLSIGEGGCSRLLYVSEGIQQLVGVDKATAEADIASLFGLVVPEDLPMLQQAIVDIAGQLEVMNTDFRFRHAQSGELRWLRSRAAPRKLTNGEVVFNGFWQDISDIKLLEEESRKSREAAETAARELRQVTDSLPGMVYRYHVGPDLRGMYTMVSDQGPTLFGRTREDILTTPNSLLNMVTREDQPKLMGAFVQAVKDGGNVDSTYRSVVANGRIAWLRTSAKPIPQNDGGIAWCGFTLDVTTEMEARLGLDAAECCAREAAERAEQRVREITESLPGVVYRMVFGARTQITDMTVGAQAMYGVPREAIMADPELISRMLHPDDRVRIRDAFMAAAQQQQGVNYDFRITRNDGALRWLRTYSAPQAGSKGLAWVGYTTDVTAEHDALQHADEATRALVDARNAAQAAEQRLRTIFDYNRIGMVMIDEQRNFSDANPSLRGLLEIEDEQEFARDFPAFSPPLQPDGRPSMEKALEVIGVAFEQGYNRFDWLHQTKAGEPRPCEIALTRVMLDGQPKLFATMTDMRERLRHEVELKTAWSQAQAASRSKSDFLANMSHEIRTPMNAIIGLSRLALRADLAPEARTHLDNIHHAAQGLLGILNDILDFSKIEAGKLSIEKISFRLDRVLENVNSLMGMKAREKGLRYSSELAGDLPPALVGDPLRIGQILMNLVGNAVKFTDSGDVAVSISCRRGVSPEDSEHTRRRDVSPEDSEHTRRRGVSPEGLEPAGRRGVSPDGLGAEADNRGSRPSYDNESSLVLQFTVRDTGIGLTTEQSEQLFESFFQADATTARRYGGTGLGLAISRRLVEAMGGTITVQSDLGIGSVFRFELPLGIASEAELDGLPGNGQPQRLDGMRLLVVDDNETNQLIACDILEDAGAEVASAFNGREAIAAVEKGRFDAVLMDVHMPEMDGYEATRRLRTDARHAGLPIIAMTASATTRDRERCELAGMNAHVGKPIDPAELISTLLRWVAMGQKTAVSVAEAQTPAASLEGWVLPGFNLVTGLARMGGRRERYVKLLRLFATSSGEPPKEIAAALATGKLDEALHLAHRLRGSAGNAGADTLAAAATELESALQSGAALEAALLQLERAWAELGPSLNMLRAPQ